MPTIVTNDDIITRPEDDEIQFAVGVPSKNPPAYQEGQTEWLDKAALMTPLGPLLVDMSAGAKPKKERTPYDQWVDRRFRVDFRPESRSKGEPAFSFECVKKCPPKDTAEQLHFWLNECTMCSSWVADAEYARTSFKSPEDERAFTDFVEKLKAEDPDVDWSEQHGPCLCGYVTLVLLPGQGVPEGEKK